MRNLVRAIEKFFDKMWEFPKEKYWWIPGGRKIAKALYWLRTHLFKSDRYHIVDLSGFNNEYDWGWCDVVSKLPLAMMKIYCEFMEEEYPGHVDWDWSSVDDENTTSEIKSKMRTRHQTMKDIHNYIRVERPLNQKLCDEMLDAVYGNFSFAPGNNINTQLDAIRADVDLNLISELHRLLEEAMEAQETYFLKAMIDIRGSLWT